MYVCDTWLIGKGCCCFDFVCFLWGLGFLFDLFGLSFVCFDLFCLVFVFVWVWGFLCGFFFFFWGGGLLICLFV